MNDKAQQADKTLDLAVDVAKFYGGLVSGGVPATAAVQIAGQYVQTLILSRHVDGQPPRREPWE